MHTVRIFVVIAALCAGSLAPRAAAQGGWRQWDIRLTDGRHREANPLGALDDEHVRFYMGEGTSADSTIRRAHIDYIAAIHGPLALRDAGVREMPPAPTGRVEQDVVVRLDGRRTVGRVTLKNIHFSEGVIEQNGAEINLKEVAYIKFAHPRRSARPRHR